MKIESDVRADKPGARGSSWSSQVKGLFTSDEGAKFSPHVVSFDKTISFDGPSEFKNRKFFTNGEFLP